MEVKHSGNLTAQAGRSVHCELSSKAVSQQNQCVMVKTHQQFVEKSAEPAAAATAATIETEAKHCCCCRRHCSLMSSCHMNASVLITAGVQAPEREEINKCPFILWRLSQRK